MQQQATPGAKQSVRYGQGFEDLQVVSRPRRGSSKTKTLLLAMLVVCFNAIGNLALAVGMKSLPESMGWNPFSYLRAMVNPDVAAGIVLLILWVLTRMALMSRADLSFALPLMALGYVVAAILGHFVLQEEVSARQWIGTGLIFAGIAVVGTTRQRTNLEASGD